MSIIKGFRVLITSDSAGSNVIADLGIVAIPILEDTGAPFSYGYKYSTSDNYTIFDDVTPDSLQIGGGFAGISNTLNIFAPIAIGFDFSSYVGNYLKLLNASGYYAIALIASSTSIEQWFLYDDSGTLIQSNAVLTNWQLAMGNCRISNLMFQNLTDPIDINTAFRILLISSRDSTNPDNTSFYCRVYNQSSNSTTVGIITWLNGCSAYVPPPTDPYSQGGESDTGGGTGTFDGTSVDVDFTSLPNLSAVDTGFISLYNPTLAQLQSLANYMWSDLFDLDTFKKLFGDPMQAILGLSIVPGPVPASGAQVVKVGNISTGISINRAASQYIDIDCGTLNVEEFWGAYLDYEPYTKAEIYLPYIGTHQIAVDDIMGKAVHIKYHIDILSGGCACEIKCGGSVLYTFIGSCAVSIPVTGSDWTNLLNGVLSAASAIGTMVATGGAAAPAAAGEIASAAVNSLKPNIEKSGSVSGSGGLMAGKVPVLILTRPRQALPASQNSFTGYPAFITRSLGAVSGYTEVHKIRLGGISATDAELDEIENLLKGGVIL